MLAPTRSRLGYAAQGAVVIKAAPTFSLKLASSPNSFDSLDECLEKIARKDQAGHPAIV
jgi:hypothetical protein